MPVRFEFLSLVLTMFVVAPVQAEPPEAIDVGSRLQPMFSDYLIDRMEGVTLQQHSPRREEVVLELDRPWEGGHSAYVSVFRDGDIYRMYYRAGSGQSEREYVAYAESDDGVNWHRPELGILTVDGSSRNNLIWTAEDRKAFGTAHNFFVFKDTNPQAPPEQRYKAIAADRFERPDGEAPMKLVPFVSEDGLHWQRLQEQPIIEDGAFDSLNVVFWDAQREEYVAYFRHNREGHKTVARATSPDFVNWGESEFLRFGDTPLEHFYTNGILPYPRAPHVYIGLPMRFVRETRQIDGEQEQIELSDAVFMSSRDGLNWFRDSFMAAWLRPGRNPGNWFHGHGNNTPVHGVLQTGEEELSVYWLENYGGAHPRIRRGTLRPEGFASVHADHEAGQMITRPLEVAGNRLLLNMATSAAGRMRVELQTANGQPIPGYTLEDCDAIFGDEIGRAVTWNGNASLDQLPDQPIRMRIEMRDADLYAFHFANEP